MNETMVTVCGNVALEPRHIVKENGLRITSFRVASTTRRFDPEQKRWMDGETTRLGVSCWMPRAERAPGRAEADELAMTLEQETWNVDAVLDPPADGAAGEGADGGRRESGKAPLEVVGS